MKGLLLKDILSVTKQLKIVLILIFFFSIVPGFSSLSFAIVYSVMLSITSLSYDERSKWHILAGTMPYSSSTLVVSKYLFGYIVAILAAVVSIIIQAIVSRGISIESFVAAIVSLFVATVLQAVNLPFMFKMGVEKGRIVFFILVFAIVFSASMFSEKIIPLFISFSENLTSFVIPSIIAVIAINIISVFVSILAYKRKFN